MFVGLPPRISRLEKVSSQGAGVGHANTIPIWRDLAVLSLLRRQYIIAVVILLVGLTSSAALFTVLRNQETLAQPLRV